MLFLNILSNPVLLTIINTTFFPSNISIFVHILLKGNIQEAVLDLMRSDTLDWSQYPIIYNSIYTDTSSWTPEEISFFQDAIYKGEKDFHQVASDVSFTSLNILRFQKYIGIFNTYIMQIYFHETVSRK